MPWVKGRTACLGSIFGTEVFRRTEAEDWFQSWSPETATDTGAEVIKTPESGEARPSPPGSGPPGRRPSISVPSLQTFGLKSCDGRRWVLPYHPPDERRTRQTPCV